MWHLSQNYLSPQLSANLSPFLAQELDEPIEDGDCALENTGDNLFHVVFTSLELLRLARSTHRAAIHYALCSPVECLERLYPVLALVPWFGSATDTP